MFQGDSPALSEAVRRASIAACRLGHGRVGSEHLLVALTTSPGLLADVLAAHGLTTAAIVELCRELPSGGAYGAADRALLAELGYGLQLGHDDAAVLDTPPAREPMLPLRSRTRRRDNARRRPRLGLDVQAVYEASLRLALARRERQHQPEHLAITLANLDPGTRWLIRQGGGDPARLALDLAAAFPTPRRNPLLRLDRRFGRSARVANLARRHQRLTGHVTDQARLRTNV